jgi:cation diffusion facilitator CzcD-associated flavoprotein CzcO
MTSTGSEHHEVAIIGCGFSGLGLAIRLQQEGADYIVLERRDRIGGTWHDNDYPGCCCDIPSHVYSYSFELNPLWTRNFPPQPEIQAYIERTAQKYGVLGRVRTSTEVLEARWEEPSARWRLRTADGTELTADVLVSAAGFLSEPSVPDIPGRERFAGAMFHSAQWDHDHDLRGERVAAIGTGASAIQFIPAIQPQVGHLSVFQRTPAWVLPRLDHDITPAEHWALRHVPGAPRLLRVGLYWLNEARVVGFRHPALMRMADRLARTHLKRQIPDPALRAKLTPSYVMGCKRILLSDDYYPALAADNVEVITDPVAEITERGIRTGSGREVELDTIIFGTGFHVVDAPIAQRIKDAEGRPLAELWGRSMQAYKGTAVSGLPNFFFMLGPNTGLGHNSMIYMIESQIEYLADALRVKRERGLSRFEVRPEAQEHYDRAVQRAMQGTVWTAGRCMSWYLDDTGRNPTLWPTWSWRYRRLTRRFDAEAYQLA